MSMGLAALIAWLLTVSIGGYMLRTWVARGGLRRQRATGEGLPPAAPGTVSRPDSRRAVWSGRLESWQKR